MNAYTFADLLCAIAAQGACTACSSLECNAIVSSLVVEAGDYEEIADLRADLESRPPGEVREAAYRVVRDLTARHPILLRWCDDAVAAALGCASVGRSLLSDLDVPDIRPTVRLVRESDERAWAAIAAACIVGDLLARSEPIAVALREQPSLRGPVLASGPVLAALRRSPEDARDIARTFFTRGNGERTEAFDAECGR